MATQADNLDTSIDNVARNLEYITRHPKPTYSIDGESWSWGELHNFYVTQMETMRKNRQQADGPWQITSFGE